MAQLTVGRIDPEVLEQVLGTGADDFWVKAARLRDRTRSRKHTTAPISFVRTAIVRPT
jgi:hypothetical protein